MQVESPVYKQYPFRPNEITPLLFLLVFMHPISKSFKISPLTRPNGRKYIAQTITGMPLVTNFSHMGTTGFYCFMGVLNNNYIGHSCLKEAVVSKYIYTKIMVFYVYARVFFLDVTYMFEGVAEWFSGNTCSVS